MKRPRPPARPAWPCACGHVEDLHHPAGRCVVALPPFLEEELPAWHCPCRGFAPVARDLFRWHPATSSWHALDRDALDRDGVARDVVAS